MGASRSDSLYFHCVGTARVNICRGFGGCGLGLVVLLFLVVGQSASDTGLPQEVVGVESDEL